ncbi:MAG: thioredoxin family protein [Deltaproteobacteria bacterium]|nr:thioredoxin family protein [Deltaproteobacteria bacterium]
MPKAIAMLALLAACGKDAAPHARVELVEAGPGEVADLVKAELARASGKRVVVYVGAAWCGPCVDFHRAAEAGELDDSFGDVRFLELDYDRDQRRLAAAGYRSKMLPLFAIPGTDGTSTGRQVEGSRKEDPVGHLVPRLRALLDETR